MMEKPLATTVSAAQQIETAAIASNVPVFVNYETTYYDNHHEMKRVVETGAIGQLRHLIARDGHEGLFR